MSDKKKEKEWMDLDQPPYNQRSGCFWEAGEEYGVGKAQPVGKEKCSGKLGVPSESWQKKVR